MEWKTKYVVATYWISLRKLLGNRIHPGWGIWNATATIFFITEFFLFMYILSFVNLYHHYFKYLSPLFLLYTIHFLLYHHWNLTEGKCGLTVILFFNFRGFLAVRLPRYEILSIAYYNSDHSFRIRHRCNINLWLF